MDDELAAKIARDDTSDLPEEHRIALRYADAHMTDPRQIDSALGADLRRRFTVGQIVELTLDVAAWNSQKISVALGTDRAADERGLSPLTFDASGHTHIGSAR